MKNNKLIYRVEWGFRRWINGTKLGLWWLRKARNYVQINLPDLLRFSAWGGSYNRGCVPPARGHPCHVLKASCGSDAAPQMAPQQELSQGRVWKEGAARVLQWLCKTWWVRKLWRLLAACKEKYLGFLWDDTARNKMKKLKFSLPKNKPKPQNTKVCSTEELPPEITWKMIHHWYF